MVSVSNPQPREHTQFLNITLADQLHAVLPTHQMVEVLSLNLEQITSIPDTPDMVIGVFNWRQQILWVIDLAQLLGQISVTDQAHNRPLDVIVVKHQTLKFGIVVLETGRISTTVADPHGSTLFLDTQELIDLISRR
jgi:positive phototaxis protein PixI